MDQLTFDPPASAGAPVLCACGCGTPTPLARWTDKRAAIIKGQPTCCIRGHGRRKRIDDDGRECCDCGTYKPWDDFYADRSTASGRSRICKTCAQIRNRAKSTGVGSGSKPRGRVDDQGRECTICGTYKPWSKYHLSRGGFRGRDSLCNKCKSDRAIEWRMANPAQSPAGWEQPTTGCPSSCGQYTEVVPLQSGIYVYRCWTVKGECIYVGKTKQVLRRLGAHAMLPWWRGVHYVDVAVMSAWPEADAEEIRQIRHWRPVNNSDHNRTFARKSTKPKPTHCPKDHEYTPENTISNARGSQVCRTCKNEKARANPKKGYARGERQHSAKLSGAAVADIRRRAARGQTISAISREYKVARATIRRVVEGKTWAHIQRPGTWEETDFPAP